MDYIAIQTVKVDIRNRIRLRNPNNISKRGNALLRLLRHAVCSMVVRTVAKGWSTPQFQKWTDKLMYDVQTCLSTDAICRSIRSAREIEKKTHKTVQKAFNARNGSVFVDGIEIAKMVWSQAIPSALNNWDVQLRSLYVCQDLITHLFDVRNKFILAGTHSKIVVDKGNGIMNDIYISEFIPFLSGGNEETTKASIYQCWLYAMGSHAYFGSGAARGVEVTRLPAFSKCQFIFGSLRYEMFSLKGEKHGVKENQLVTHWLSPSISRRVILQELSLYPAIISSDRYSLPNATGANKAADEMFANVMGLSKPAGSKINRDLIAQMTNFIAPKSLGRTSTHNRMAAQFHHSEAIHDEYYSSSTYIRDNDGIMVPSSFMTAQDIWRAFGENDTSFTQGQNNTISHRSLDRSHYDMAAQYAFKHPAARISDEQFSAIMHEQNIAKHAFIFMGCGTGKSGIYILSQLARVLNGMKPHKNIVISPHNALLTQHRLQALKYFAGTSLKVTSLLPMDISNPMSIQDDFDLLFISIHAFKELIDSHYQRVMNWHIDTIFVDEYHNIFGEIFRHANSWIALRNLASLKARIMCMSATANGQLIEYVAQYLQMGNYEIIGSERNYHMPKVAITVERCNEKNIIDVVIERVHQLNRKKKYRFKIHIVTMTRDDAEDICKRLCQCGVTSIWLTSKLLQSEKVHTMKTWEEQDDQVIVTTFTDGIDNPLIEDVISVRARHSAVSLIQALGRIRPGRQFPNRATLHILDTGYDPTSSREDADTLNYIMAANLIPNAISRPIASTFFTKLFHISGYRQIIEGHHCYRRALLEVCGVRSVDCGFCSYCSKKNAICHSANEASIAITKVNKDRHFVLQQLQLMLKTCMVCEKAGCDGTRCLGNQRHRCWRCHAFTPGKNWHTTKDCIANTISRGKICPFCLLAFTPDMPTDTSLEKHQRGKCVYQERIRRVLLYQVASKHDKGQSARNVLEPCARSTDIWFEKMAMNLKQIRFEKMMANNDDI